jgi:hypothetical protein
MHRNYLRTSSAVSGTIARPAIRAASFGSLDEFAQGSEHFLSKSFGRFESDGQGYSLPR